MSKYAEAKQTLTESLINRIWRNNSTLIYNGSTEARIILEALEKQIPKKPTHIDKNGKFDGNWIKACPVCGMKLVERFTTEDMSYPRVYHKAKYCECGQALDWSDTE